MEHVDKLYCIDVSLILNILPSILHSIYKEQLYWAAKYIVDIISYLILRFFNISFKQLKGTKLSLSIK